MMENTVNNNIKTTTKTVTDTEVKVESLFTVESFFTPEKIEEIHNFLVNNHFYFPTYIVFDNENNKEYKFGYRSLKYAFHKLNCIKDGKIEGKSGNFIRTVAEKKSYLVPYFSIGNINPVEEREIGKTTEKLKYCTGKLADTIVYSVSFKDVNEDITVNTFSEAVNLYNNNKNSMYIEAIAKFEGNKELRETLIAKEEEIPFELVYDVTHTSITSKKILSKIKKSIEALEGREKYALMLKYFNLNDEHEYSKKLNISFQTSKKVLGNALLLMRTIVAA